MAGTQQLLSESKKTFLSDSTPPFEIESIIEQSISEKSAALSEENVRLVEENIQLNSTVESQGDDIEFLNETELRDDSIVFKLDNNKNLKIQVEEVGEEYGK